MSLRAIVINNGDVKRYPVSGPATEIHIIRTEAGDVLVRIYDRAARYGDSGAVTELSTAQLATPGAVVRVVFEEQ